MTRAASVCYRHVGVVLWLILASAPLAEPETPWPANVPGFVAPKSGEHPRLFFRRTDLPALKKRAETPEGKHILAHLHRLLKGKYTLWHGAGYGFLYQLTGDTKYADLGRRAVEQAYAGKRDADFRYGLPRGIDAGATGASLGAIAMAYDLCYDGWDPKFRQGMAIRLLNHGGFRISLPELARGSDGEPREPKWAGQVGGAALVLLAIRGDPEVHNWEVERLLKINAKSMLRQLKEGFGDHGYFWTGPETGQRAAYTSFLPALLAWKHAGGKDYITPRPRAGWISLRWCHWLVSTRKGLRFPNPVPDVKRAAEQQMDVNRFVRDQLTAGGHFAHGFGMLRNEREKAALLWVYENVVAPAEKKEYAEMISAAGGPHMYDTVSPYPHRVMFSFLHWPTGTKPVHPEKVLPKALRDSLDYYVFRNRWRDDKDTVITVLCGAQAPQIGRPMKIRGMGDHRQCEFPRGWPTYYKSAASGSAVLSVSAPDKKVADVSGVPPAKAEIGMEGDDDDGDALTLEEKPKRRHTQNACLAVDFSRASGAEALVIGVGRGVLLGGSSERAKMVAPIADGWQFQILILGTAPPPKVKDKQVIIGKQTIQFDGERIILGQT